MNLLANLINETTLRMPVLLFIGVLVLYKCKHVNHKIKSSVEKDVNFRNWNFETMVKNFGINTSVQISDLYARPFDDDENALCVDRGKNLKVFLAVLSSVKNFRERYVIRKTWGNVKHRKNVGIAFFIGLSDSKGTQEGINKENKIYGDVVQGIFNDNYFNLTLKVAAVFDWISKKCQKVKFVVKIDDDVFMNIPKLLQLLDKHQNAKYSIFGFRAIRLFPFRKIKTKFHISQKEFPRITFPPYMIGPAYVMTNDFIADALDLIYKAPFFKFEDVFFTGFIAYEAMKVKLVHCREFRLRNARILPEACYVHTKTIAWHSLSPHEIKQVWKKTSTLTIDRCK